MITARENTPALDIAAIRRLEGELPSGLLDAALESFAAELDRRGGELARLDPARDAAELSALAHGLKGSASTFGAPGLAGAAERLEQTLAADELSATRAATRHLAVELERAVSAMREMLVSRAESRR